MSGINSTATVVSGIHPSPNLRDQEGQGEPVEIGRDFYINRSLFRDVETASSLSSLSGVIATTSDLQLGGQSTVETSRSTFVGEGRFSTLGKKARRSFQAQLDTVEASPRRETDTSREGSPWYIVHSPRGVNSKNIETVLCSPGQDGPKKSSASSDGLIIDVPKIRMITSREHLDDLLRFHPPVFPPPAPSNHAVLGHHISDDLEVSGLSHIHASENSSVGGNEGFLAYVGEKYSNASCKMKLLFTGGVIVFLMCIIAITAASLNMKIGSNNDSEVDQSYDNDKNIPSGGDDGYFPIGLEGNTTSTTNDVLFDLEEELAVTDSLTPTSSPSDPISNVPTTESPTVLSALPTTESTSVLHWLILPVSTTEPSIGPASQTSGPSFSPSGSSSASPTTTSQTSGPSFSLSGSSSASPTTTPGLPKVVLTPISDTTTIEDNPASSYGKDSYLTVKGLRGASSFLRFDISAVSGNTVSMAILRMYSILRTDDEIMGEVVGGVSNVNVNVLPFAGIWDENMVSFDDPVISVEAASVGSFTVEGYPFDLSSLFRLQRVHEVDVTKAFRGSKNSEGLTTITFMLYSDDNTQGLVDFASSEYSETFGGPEVVIDFSETQYPTSSPTTSALPTSAPVLSPTLPPSIPPTRKPSSSPTPDPSPVPTDNCIDQCESEVTENFSIEDYIDTCVENFRNCDRQCKNNCKSEAEIAKEESLIFCKETC